MRTCDGFKNAIVFCNRKREVAQLHKSLLRHGFNAAALHGDLDQAARTAALDQFRKGEVTLLIASDVAARGLDIPAVSHVFNFDVPHHADDYVHRIGRTGRAGLPGTAITIVAPSDGKSIAAIEKLIGQPIAWMNGTPAPAADAPAAADDEPRRRQPRSAGHQRPARPSPPRRESGSVARLDEARQVKKAAAPAKPWCGRHASRAWPTTTPGRICRPFCCGRSAPRRKTARFCRLFEFILSHKYGRLLPVHHCGIACRCQGATPPDATANRGRPRARLRTQAGSGFNGGSG